MPWGQEQRVNVVEPITELRFAEVVRLDSDQLDNLIRTLGPRAAEDIVCRAIEDLASRLTRCERAATRRELGELRKELRGLRDLAGELGMTAVKTTAGFVRDCINAGDMVALDATVARLVRLGDLSLYAVWDIEGLSV